MQGTSYQDRQCKEQVIKTDNARKKVIKTDNAQKNLSRQTDNARKKYQDR